MHYLVLPSVYNIISPFEWLGGEWMPDNAGSEGGTRGLFIPLQQEDALLRQLPASSTAFEE
jgi:hypothetical protein